MPAAEVEFNRDLIYQTLPKTSTDPIENMYALYSKSMTSDAIYWES